MDHLGVFNRGSRSRIIHFLYLIPLLIGFRPLLIRFDWTVFIIYTIGFLLLLFFIIYSNRIPYIIYDEDAFYIQLEYREGREIHKFDEILGYYRLRKSRFMLYSLEHKPLSISLGRKDGERFAKLLESKGVSVVQKKVAQGKA